MKKLNINNFAKISVGGLSWIFLIFFGWIFFNCVFRNSNDLVHYNMRTIIPISILLLILIILFVTFNNKVFINNSFFNRNKKIFLILSFLFIFITQIILARKIYFDCGWDAGLVIRCAKAFVEDVSAFDIGYFLRFPNNIFLLWLEKNIYIFSRLLSSISYEFLLVIINVILVDISILLSLLVARKLLDNTTLIISYIFSILILLFSPWIVVPYSDTFSMVFPILNIYLYLKIKESKKIQSKVILALLIGVLSIIGYQIKPTAIISLIAIVISGLLYSFKDKKSFKLYFLIVACIGVSASVAKIVYNNTIYTMEVNGVKLNSDEDSQAPMTHFLMMGLNTREIEDRGTLYGAWREEDYNITFSYKTKQEKIDANIHEYVDRVRNLGIFGYLKYLSQKGNWMLSDGTFYYGGEGNFAMSDPYSDSGRARFLQSYYSFNGENYNKQASIRQAAWILILFFIVIPVIFGREDRENEILFTIRLSLIGILIFLLLFEGRSRYFLNHLPLFIVLASYGASKLYARCNTLITNINSFCLQKHKKAIE